MAQGCSAPLAIALVVGLAFAMFMGIQIRSARAERRKLERQHHSEDHSGLVHVKPSVTASEVQAILQQHPLDSRAWDCYKQNWAPSAGTSMATDQLYGEIKETGFAQILNYLPPACSLQPEDVFYEVGGGIGRFAMYVRLQTNISRVASLEINECRNDIAVAMHKKVSKSYPQLMKSVSFEAGDVRKTGLADATVVHISPTAWSEELVYDFWHRLATEAPKLRCVVATANVLDASEDWGLSGGWATKRVADAIRSWGHLHRIRKVDGWHSRVHAGFYARAPCDHAECKMKTWRNSDKHTVKYFLASSS